MPKIILKDVCLSYPVYNVGHCSIRHQLLNAATGGKISDASKRITLIRALTDINLHLEAGDRLGVIGHNGAGKSTLLRCISGIYQPTSGQLIREGTVGSFLDIGAGLEPELSGYDNIYRLLMFRGIYKKKEVAPLVEEIIDFSELGDFIKMPVKTYSSGMVTRLIFSTITSKSPEIMVMDEFFGAGDASFQERAEERLKRGIDQALILVFASHNLKLIKKMCNKYIRLKNGYVEEVSLED